jgi:carbonic anhydrase
MWTIWCRRALAVALPFALSFALVVVLAGCSATAPITAQHPSHSNDPAPPCADFTVSQSDVSQRHYALPGLDHGLIQSPINILSAGVTEQTHVVQISTSDEKVASVERKAHTVQVNLEPGASITFDDRRFELVQIHFHTPSEHQVDGVTFPMEAHVVNVSDKGTTAAPEYLVLGVLFKMGDPNSFIGRVLENIPQQLANEPVDPSEDDVYVADIFEGVGDGPSESRPYYHYRGSLTTPPYTESVEWLVHKEIFEASQQQIEQINELEGDNARHVQALYGRGVGN